MEAVQAAEFSLLEGLEQQQQSPFCLVQGVGGLGAQQGSSSSRGLPGTEARLDKP